MTNRNFWVLAVLVMALGACASSEEPMQVTQEEAASGPAPPLVQRMRTLEAEVRGIAAERVWSAQLTGGQRVERAWLSGSTLLLETFNPDEGHYVIHSVDVTDGSGNWQVVVGANRLARAPHVGDGSVAFLTETDNGMILVNSTTGSRVELFNARLQVVAASDATSNSDTVFLGNHMTQRLVAAAPDGRKGWDRVTDGLCVTTPVLTSALPRQLLIFATQDGELSALHAKSHDQVPPRSTAWTRMLPGGVTADPMEMVLGEGAKAASLLVVPCHDGFLYGINPATGRSHWPPIRTDAPFKSMPGAANGRIYVRNADRMFCIDAASGQRAWWPPSTASAKEYPKKQLFGKPEGFEVADRVLAGNDDRVYLLQEPNMVFRCDASNGNIEGVYALTGFDFIMTNSVSGALVVGTHDGIFMAFQ